jgi:hypothetical protein
MTKLFDQKAFDHETARLSPTELREVAKVASDWGDAFRMRAAHKKADEMNDALFASGVQFRGQ